MINPENTMMLKTSRLILRAWNENDAEDLRRRGEVCLLGRHIKQNNKAVNKKVCLLPGRLFCVFYLLVSRIKVSI